MPSAFDSIADGEAMQADNVQQIIDAWQGVASKGVPLSLTTVSSEGSYAADFKNEDTVNRRVLRGQDADGTARLDYSGQQVKVTDLVLSHQATPSAPGASKMALYAKSDGLLYKRDGAAGSETAIGGAFSDGTVGAPGAAFASDTDNGLYRVGANTWALVAGGVEIARLTTTTFGVDTNVLLVDVTNNRVGVNDSAPDFALDVAGDARIQGSGKLYFGGTGAADNDVNLFRSAADTLETDDALVVNGVHRAGGGLRVGSGSVRVTAILRGTATWDPASLADDDATRTSVTVTGAAVGDFCLVSHSGAEANEYHLTGQVTGSNAVEVTLTATAGAADLASGTLVVIVLKISAT